MGVISSLFKKKVTTKEQLESIQSQIEYLEEYKWSTIRSQKNTIGLLFFTSAFIFVIVAFVLYFHYLPLSTTWQEKLLISLPLIILPIMVYFVKNILQWYYRWDLDVKTDKLIELKRQKKKILDKVMETETYKIAKEILEKYEPSSLKEKDVQSTSFNSSSVSRTPLNNVNTSLRYRGTPSALNKSQNLPLRPNLPPTPMNQRGPAAPMARVITPFISNMPQPRLVRPIPSQDRGVVEKLVDYVVGDGPSNRYALICNFCKSHNGMALKDEFEFIAFRCCYCFSLNPARKQRPFAPIRSDLMIEGAPKRDSLQPVVDEPESDSDSKAKKDDNTVEHDKQNVDIVEVTNESPAQTNQSTILSNLTPTKVKSNLPDTSVFDENDDKTSKMSSHSAAINPRLTTSSVAHQLTQQHPRIPNIRYNYGTAGFRGVANILPSVCLRMGMLGAIKSRSCANKHSEGNAIGIMITASHNEEKDNGVKMVEPDGEMMHEEWEAIAITVANEDEKSLVERLHQISQTQNAKWDEHFVPTVIVGHDTRPSSRELADLVVKGAQALGAYVKDFGLVTTPQLHYLVHEYNKREDKVNVGVNDYYKLVYQAFVDLIREDTVDEKETKSSSSSSSSSSTARPVKLSDLYVDCANGVGHLSIQTFANLLSDIIKIQPFNIGKGTLNFKCGADFVQSTRSMPLGVDPDKDVGKKFASIDGDADRVVYFYVDQQKKMRLLDGDKIIALFASYLIPLIKQSGLNISLGIVQTAYANGASTIYMWNKLNLPIACTNTGVKFLHRKAVEYDIGLYFEANGHGTIIFSKKCINDIQNAIPHATSQSKLALSKLLNVSKLINQCVGDAVCDLLLIEVILHKMSGLEEWNGFYSDLPSRLLKVQVKDPSVVKTTDAERRTIAPKGLQEKIDEIVRGSGGEKQDEKTNVRRAFVRPSGTEPVVRVYAEGSTQEEADNLSNQVKLAVLQFCS